MKPKWVVFDLGGVIFDWHNCLESITKYLNFPQDIFIPTFQKYLPALELGRITPEQGFEKMLGDLGVVADAEKIAKIWVSTHLEIKSTQRLINRLSPVYSLALCTNIWVGVIAQLEVLFPETFQNFTTIIDSSQINHRKPEFEIYKQVESVTRSHGDSIFFIDDMQLNIDAAKSLNWQTFLFDYKIDKGIKSCDEISRILFEYK